MNKKPIYLFLLISSLFSAFLYASEFYDDKERGWFWREEFPEPQDEKPEEVQPAPTPAPAPEKKSPPVKPLSAEWMRKNLPIMLDKAVDDPTPENVRAYRYAELWALRKADKYAEASMKATLTDPYLDSNTYAPMSAAGEESLAASSSEGRRYALNIMKNRVGIWFFFRSDCTFCHRQAMAVNTLKNSGMPVMAISVDGLPMHNGLFKDFTTDRGQAAMMGVETVPSIFMVDTKTKAISYIAQGIISADELETRIIEQARDMHIITEATYQKTRFSKQNNDDVNLNPEDGDNPEKMIAGIRQALRKQFIYQNAK